MSKYLGRPGEIVGEDVDPNTGIPYPRGYQPGVMVGEDVYPRGYQPGVMVGEDVSQSVARQNSDGTYTPGYVEIPGKGQRYQTSDGRLFHNHLGPSLTQLGNIPGQIDSAYTDYYNSMADAAGTPRRDGSQRAIPPKKQPSTRKNSGGANMSLLGPMPRLTGGSKSTKNSLTKLSDGSLRTSGGDVYSSDGSRYTSGGVTYDRKTGQAVNPATNQITTNGYSIDPLTNTRIDFVKKEPDPNTGNGAAAAQREKIRTGTELERYRVFVKANEDLAKDVKPGQAGYEEIQAVLAEKEGGPAADEILGTMYQYDRSAEDARNLLSDKPMSLEWNTDMPITGRSVAAPLSVDGVPQTGTLMGGSITPGLFANTLGNQGYTEGDLKNSFTSIALPGTPDARAQMQLLPAEIQTPEGLSNVEIDSISGAGNNFATALDQSRALGFISGEDAQRITERFYRK